MKRPKSDIPQNAVEVLLSEYHEEGPLIYFRVVDCVLNHQVVGRRAYDQDGTLRIETPLKNGKKHGREYVWDETDALESVEPYREGKLHGLAKQYGRNGDVIGTYRFTHGTGYDIWRYEKEDGSIGVSEIHSIQDGSPHGFEWWLNADQHSIWHELHWSQGKYHGIERMWNERGKLKKGYPKFWIQGKAVTRRAYVKAAEQDETLPDYQETEDRPQRRFPETIENLL